MATMTYTDTLTIIECGNCRITFAIPVDMNAARLKDGKRFWCPNGHNISYSDHENVRLKRQLQRAEARERHLADQLEATERSHRATKGQLTRVRKRAMNGVCPCCKRTFANVVEHMKTKHPEAVEKTA